MYGNDEFLWGGLRTRLERMGRVRPRTIRLAAVGQRREVVQRQLRLGHLEPALGARLRGVAAERPVVSRPARARA